MQGERKEIGFEMDKYFCSRCGRILNQYEYKNYVCLCMECVNMVENEFEDGKPWGDINNIDEALENKRGKGIGQD